MTARTLYNGATDNVAAIVAEAQEPLADLTRKAHAAMDVYEDAVRSSVLKALALGRVLLEAKAQVSSGRWTAWLKATFPKSDRAARKALTLAKRWPDDEVASERLAGMSIDAALAVQVEPDDESALPGESEELNWPSKANLTPHGDTVEDGQDDEQEEPKAHDPAILPDPPPVPTPPVSEPEAPDPAPEEAMDDQPAAPADDPTPTPAPTPPAPVPAAALKPPPAAAPRHEEAEVARITDPDLLASLRRISEVLATTLDDAATRTCIRGLEMPTLPVPVTVARPAPAAKPATPAPRPASVAPPDRPWWLCWRCKGVPNVRDCKRCSDRKTMGRAKCEAMDAEG